MKLYQVVYKDILSRKKRVLYAMLGVVIGTMTVVGILTIAQAGQARITDQLEKYGPNLTIVPAITNINMSLGDLSLGTVTVGETYISQDKLPRIRQIADGLIKKALDIKDDSNIAIIAPKLYVSSQIKNTSVMLVGVEPEGEKKIKTWWQVKEGEYINDANQVMVGSVAAELLKLKVGDALQLKGNEVAIAGILEETGANDDYQIFVPLSTLQKAFGKEGSISSIDIRALCNACPVDIIADAINQDISEIRAVAVKQVAETEMGMLHKINKFMLALAGVTLIVGGFGVVNTLMTSIHERIKDIGIMRAVGASRRQIIIMLVYEAIIIGIGGGILGYGVGTLLAYAIGPLIFEGISIAFVIQYFPLSLVLAIAVAVIATIYPALRATKIRVADSFRSI